MISIVAVLSLTFAVALSVDDADFALPKEIKDIIGEQGKQYALYVKHTEAIGLPKHADKDLLLGLDIKRDEKVDVEDLKTHFWHKDVNFAVQRFIDMIDDDGNKIIDASDLKNDLKKKEYKVALSDCKFLKSPGLRQSCYADDLLTYILLAVGDTDTQQFVDYLSGTPGPGQPIPLDNIKNVLKKYIEKKPDKYDIENTLEELGAYYGEGENQVTYKELDDYISQESILDDLRRCRTLKDDKPDFLDDCLAEELVEYTNDDLTDIDIALLFRLLDKDVNDQISERELKHLPGVKTETNHRDVLDLLDMDGPDDQNVDFAEFRAYLRSPTVLIQLEKACTVPEKTQLKEIECIYKHFTQLALDLHYPIWLDVPDLDQEITFEIFDANNDGKLDEKELKDDPLFKENPLTLTRFIDEVESPDDDDEYIDLEEFNEYMDIPHMIYGTADCLLVSRANKDERGTCFTGETVDIVDNIKYLQKTAFKTWFESLQTNKNGHIDMDDKLEDIGDAKKELFLEELGQGSDIVTEFEFTWYTKQQELADKYDKDDEGGIKGVKEGDEIKQHTSTLNKLILKYIEEQFTEFDAVELFKYLDKDDDSELTVDDFDDSIEEQMKTLLESIDKTLPEGDADTTVNFLEFWLWLNEPHGHVLDSKRKDKWEKECQAREDKQETEIKCLVKKFKASTPE